MSEHSRVVPLSMAGANYNVIDEEKFDRGLKLLMESIDSNSRASFFCSDNLITWNRNLSFLRDEKFIKTLNNKEKRFEETAIVWRTYVIRYFALLASKVPGDFLELGCHTGYTASQVIKKVNFKALKKKYYLYDQFDATDFTPDMKMKAHNDPLMYEGVVKKFREYSFVSIIKGTVPGSFKEGFPETVAFAHIDMNHPDPETAALEKVLPRLSNRGIVIFDDYGWWAYSAQKRALDKIMVLHDYEILELPTGQGLFIKP